MKGLTAFFFVLVGYIHFFNLELFSPIDLTIYQALELGHIITFT